ncbi:MAG: BrnA antitoxin family protein [Pseudomonadota bacterium]|nr:BrnA antitoxin family protein [Pseudomonadota bacterium]
MNKEFVQEEWDAPSAAGSTTAAPKSNVVPLKQIVTIRLDTDTLEWFKGAGPGYQTRINQILRQYMADHRADGDGAKPN